MLSSLATRISLHPRRSLIVTLILVIVAGVVGGPVAGALKGSGGFAPDKSESQLATNQLEAATGSQATPGIVLLVSAPNGAPAAAARIRTLDRTLQHVPGVVGTEAPAAVSRDGREVLITATLSAAADDKASAQAAAAAFKSDSDVAVGGPQVADEQISSEVTKGLAMAELLAFPLLVILSLVFFRGRATLMPLAVGMTTVLGTFLVLTGVNHLYGLSIFALNLVIGLGLGLAVDYTLFLVTRYREELANQQAGRTTNPILTTMTHAGRTVIFSALTVAAAMATLTVFPQGFLRSMGIAGAIVALVAATAAVTISPALMGLWGPKLARRDAARGRPQDGRWYRFAHAVMRRPGVIALVTAAVMVAAATPSLSTVWTPASDSRVIPKGQSSRTVADAVGSEFAGAGKQPVTVAITAPASAGAEVRGFAGRVAQLPAVTRLTGPARYLGNDTWQLNAEAPGDAAGARAQQVVREIRALPASFTKRVTGDAATFVDQQAAISSHLALAIGLLAALTFVILWLLTDSVVLPVKALLMNALTVGASLAPLALIYQHGHLTGLLGYTPNGGVEPTDFVVAATVVFALSTDYGVFLLGGIKEARDRLARDGGPVDEREAVAVGLGATGRVVTAAAILLAVAIGAFSTSSISFIQQIGVATATGVLLDAFVVRSLLAPSLMALLGRWNWWSPGSMRRLRARIVPADPSPAAQPRRQIGSTPKPA